MAQSRVRWPESFGHQYLNRLSDELAARIAEYGFGLCVGEQDDPVRVHQQDRTGDRFDDGTKALFAYAEPGCELRRGDEVPDQFVAHRQDNDEKARHQDGGRVHDAGNDQRGEASGRENAQGKAAADQGRAAARHRSAPAPQRDRGIDNERDEQQIGKLRDDRPRIRDADRPDDDGASPELQMIQRSNRLKVHVDAGQEIQREGDQPNADHRPGEPESAGVEVQVHEPDARDDDHRKRNVRPACEVGEAVRRRGPHACQLEGAVRRGRHGQYEEQEVGELRTLLLPDEQMNNAEHQARRNHHDPGDFDPVHPVTGTEGAVAARWGSST